MANLQLIVSIINKGKDKIYLCVPGNLIAYACKVSVEMGYHGFLAFDAKTALIKHYEESLHAMHFRGLGMFIETKAALFLFQNTLNHKHNGTNQRTEKC